MAVRAKCSSPQRIRTLSHSHLQEAIHYLKNQDEGTKESMMESKTVIGIRHNLSNQNKRLRRVLPFALNGKPVLWRPGMEDKGNLHGTIRTLDGVHNVVPLEPGLLSRDGLAFDFQFALARQSRRSSRSAFGMDRLHLGQKLFSRSRRLFELDGKHGEKRGFSRKM